MRVPFGVWVVAGVAVGAAAAAVLLASGVLDRESVASDPVVDDVDERARAGDEFVAAWERSRLGTYVVESTLERTFPDGTRVTFERAVAQRPPDRLERSAGAVTARSDDQVVRCQTEERRYRCSSGRAERSYRSLVRDEVETMRSYVAGDVPLYAVEADGGCFSLTQVHPLPAPPYGTAARFCFDESTGALTDIRIERAEATDLTEATSVRAEVDEEDLTPPEDGDPSRASVPDRDEG